MFSTLRTLMRASAAEAEEAMIDANGARLLAQHLREARLDVARGRKTLSSLIVREKEETRRIDEAKDEIKRREAEAAQAMAAGEDALAGDIAERIVALEDQCDRSATAWAELNLQISTLRGTLAQAERRIAKLADDLRAARAGAASRSAKAALSIGDESSALEQAEAMSERLRKSGARAEDAISSLTPKPLSETADLDTRLLAAGIANDASKRRNGVLDRLRSAASA